MLIHWDTAMKQEDFSPFLTNLRGGRAQEKDYKWFLYAVERCLALPVPPRNQHRVYCVALNRRGHKIAESSNSYIKTHPYQARITRKEGKVYLHAEVSTLLRARGQSATLYVARVGRSGRVLPSCPCDSCRVAIKDSGIERVVYVR